jgi:hypothetical protein
MIYSIFSGDLVKSSQLSGDALDHAMETIHTILQGHQNDCVRFTRNRGDGWQAALANQVEALHAAIALLANLRVKGLNSRIAIGVGTIEYLGSKDLSDARGAAFTASGHALDEMHRSQLLAISGPNISNEDKAIVALLDERVSRWSREQAEAVAKSMAPNGTTDKANASSLGITPQAMSDRLQNAGFPSMIRALELWKHAKIDQSWTHP